MNSINNSTKVEMVVIGSPSANMNTHWITLKNLAANTHYYANNDYGTAVRNTPEIRERIVAFWTAKLEEEISYDLSRSKYYTQAMKDKCVAWTERMLSLIQRQVAEGQDWILIRVAPEEQATVRAALA